MKIILTMIAGVLACSTVASSHPNISIQTPAQIAAHDKSNQYLDDARIALSAGNYSLAESDSREALVYDPNLYNDQAVLADTLNAEGKSVEAMKLYELMHALHDTSPEEMLPYSLLLLRQHQFAKSLEVYNSELPYVGEPFIKASTLLNEDNDFTVDNPDPVKLESDIHVALGFTRIDDYGIPAKLVKGQPDYEFKEALRLEPLAPIANLAYDDDILRFGDYKAFRAAMTIDAQNYKGDAKIAAEEELGTYTGPLSTSSTDGY